MRTNSMTVICGALIALAIGISSVWAAKPKVVPQTPLTEVGQKIETRYAEQLERLRTELTAKIPQNDQAKANTLNEFLASDVLDAEFAKYVVLLEATPRGLAEFAQQGREYWVLVEQMLANADLMKQMLVADGANAKRQGKSYGPAQYGQAMKIYTDIQKASKKAATGVLQRLALAISLEHAVPIEQANPRLRPTPLKQSTQ
jgi:hypothetical protein